MSKRNPGTLGIWGPNGTRVVASESMWNEPVKWNRDAGRNVIVDYKTPDGRVQVRPRVFCASLGDVFEDWTGLMLDAKGEPIYTFDSGHEPWTPSDSSPPPAQRLLTMDDVRARLFRLIDATPNLDWLLLTKRPENIAKMMPLKLEFDPDASRDIGAMIDTPVIRRNVWLGVSVENQEQADKRIPPLLRTPAAVRFLSCEPLLGPIDLRSLPNPPPQPAHPLERGHPFTKILGEQIQWVIVGGESGHGARPCNIEWIRNIVRQCKSAEAACFVKQLGAQPVREVEIVNDDSQPCGKDAHRIALRDKKGGDIAEWPADLQIREFPKVGQNV